MNSCPTCQAGRRPPPSWRLWPTAFSSTLSPSDHCHSSPRKRICHVKPHHFSRPLLRSPGGGLRHHCVVPLPRRAAFPRPPRRSHLLAGRSEEHTSELQSLRPLVCRLLLEKKL